MLLGFEIGQRWPEAVMHSCEVISSPFLSMLKDDRLLKALALNTKIAVVSIGVTLIGIATTLWLILV
jgi:hypothetical protein